jgi:hypothetical protein
MNGLVCDINTLNEKFSKLQNSSINWSEAWEARVFEKLELNDTALSVLIREFKNNLYYDNLSLYEEYAKKGEWNPEEYRLTTNLELIALADWENYFEQRIDYWSNFELISKESKLRFNQEVFTENNRILKDELYKCLESRKLLNAYKINENKFDTYDLWGAQIFEDFVFELEKEILTISFGWSS